MKEVQLFIEYYLPKLVFIILCYLAFAGVKLFLRYKKNRLVEVNCWFCNEWFFVKADDENSFVCKFCDQYNGFQENGDYNTEIFQHNAQTTATIFNYKSLNKRNINNLNKNSSNTSNGLCNDCNNNLELKTRALADFTPKFLFDYEIEKYKKILDDRYQICESCDQIVKNKLYEQSKFLLGQRLVDSKNRSPLKRKSRNTAITHPIFTWFLNTPFVPNVLLILQLQVSILTLMINFKTITLDLTNIFGLGEYIDVIEQNEWFLVLNLIGLVSQLILSLKNKLTEAVTIATITPWLGLTLVEALSVQKTYILRVFKIIFSTSAILLAIYSRNTSNRFFLRKKEASFIKLNNSKSVNSPNTTADSLNTTATADLDQFKNSSFSSQGSFKSSIYNKFNTASNISSLDVTKTNNCSRNNLFNDTSSVYSEFSKPVQSGQNSISNPSITKFKVMASRFNPATPNFVEVSSKFEKLSMCEESLSGVCSNSGLNLFSGLHSNSGLNSLSDLNSFSGLQANSGLKSFSSLNPNSGLNSFSNVHSNVAMQSNLNSYSGFSAFKSFSNFKSPSELNTSKSLFIKPLRISPARTEHRSFSERSHSPDLYLNSNVSTNNVNSGFHLNKSRLDLHNTNYDLLNSRCETNMKVSPTNNFDSKSAPYWSLDKYFQSADPSTFSNLQSNNLESVKRLSLNDSLDKSFSSEAFSQLGSLNYPSPPNSPFSSVSQRQSDQGYTRLENINNFSDSASVKSGFKPIPFNQNLSHHKISEVTDGLFSRTSNQSNFHSDNVSVISTVNRNIPVLHSQSIGLYPSMQSQYGGTSYDSLTSNSKAYSQINGELNLPLNGNSRTDIFSMSNPQINGISNPKMNGISNPYMNGISNPKMNGISDSQINGISNPQIISSSLDSNSYSDRSSTLLNSNQISNTGSMSNLNQISSFGEVPNSPRIATSQFTDYKKTLDGFSTLSNSQCVLSQPPLNLVKVDQVDLLKFHKNNPFSSQSSSDTSGFSSRCATPVSCTEPRHNIYMDQGVEN